MTTFPLLHWAPTSATGASYPGLKEYLEGHAEELSEAERALLAKLHVEVEGVEQLDEAFWGQVLEAVRAAMAANPDAR